MVIWRNSARNHNHCRHTTIRIHDNNGTVCEDNEDGDSKRVKGASPDFHFIYILITRWKQQEHESARHVLVSPSTWRGMSRLAPPSLARSKLKMEGPFSHHSPPFDTTTPPLLKTRDGGVFWPLPPSLTPTTRSKSQGGHINNANHRRMSITRGGVYERAGVQGTLAFYLFSPYLLTGPPFQTNEEGHGCPPRHLAPCTSRLATTPLSHESQDGGVCTPLTKRKMDTETPTLGVLSCSAPFLPCSNARRALFTNHYLSTTPPSDLAWTWNGGFLVRQVSLKRKIENPTACPPPSTWHIGYDTTTTRASLLVTFFDQTYSCS